MSFEPRSTVFPENFESSAFAPTYSIIPSFIAINPG